MLPWSTFPQVPARSFLVIGRRFSHKRDPGIQTTSLTGGTRLTDPGATPTRCRNTASPNVRAKRPFWVCVTPRLSCFGCLCCKPYRACDAFVPDWIMAQAMAPHQRTRILRSTSSSMSFRISPERRTRWTTMHSGIPPTCSISPLFSCVCRVGAPS